MIQAALNAELLVAKRLEQGLIKIQLLQLFINKRYG